MKIRLKCILCLQIEVILKYNFLIMKIFILTNQNLFFNLSFKFFEENEIL